MYQRRFYLATITAVATDIWKYLRSDPRLSLQHHAREGGA